MNRLDDVREQVRRFNEDETTWRRFQKRRVSRRLSRSRDTIAEEILDHLDWIAADRECRDLRVFGLRVQ
jgi:hypothetical protein